MSKIKSIISKQSALIALIIIFIIAALCYPLFHTWTNLYNLLRQNSMIGLISVAMTMVILTGGIDLSVGAVCSMISVIAAYLSFTENPFLILVLPLLIHPGERPVRRGVHRRHGRSRNSGRGADPAL